MAVEPTAQKRDASISSDDEVAVKRLSEAYQGLLNQLGKVIVGQQEVVDQLMIAVFARGHCLLEGVPGLAKTLLVASLADCLSLSFKRVQFTPDLMPSDITGSEILQDDPETGSRAFKFLKGPIFTNLLLADEINRTPPKTQAALLEAMQERQVSAAGQDFKLDEPFFVLATQNPLDQEGTYPLPEAQLDRFIFKVQVGYPSREEEVEIMRRVTGGGAVKLSRVLTGEQIVALQKLVRRIPVTDHVLNYAAMLVRASRPGEAEAPKFVSDWVSFGAGPRASLNLILAGKARAALRGRFHVSVGDIQKVALPVLRHRLMPNYAAQSEGLTSDQIVTKLLKTIPVDEQLYDGHKNPKPTRAARQPAASVS